MSRKHHTSRLGCVRRHDDMVGNGRRKYAVNESRGQTADRIARYQNGVSSRQNLAMLLVQQHASAALKVLSLCSGSPVRLGIFIFSVIGVICCCIASLTGSVLLVVFPSGEHRALFHSCG